MNKYLKTNKCFAYEKHERRFHSIVISAIELICVVLLLFMGYFIYDTLMVKKSTRLDNYIKEFKPVITETDTKASLADLQAINDDIIAWLTIDDTSIDYPILHNGENYSYINRDIYGKGSLAGSLYTDVIADRNFHDDYTIVYGHHMDGGMMLGCLDEYMENDYLKSHNKGTLITTDKIYNLTALALLQVEAHEKFYTKTNLECFNELKENPDAYTILSGTLNAEYDKLLILSTCYGGGMDRLILILSMEERK